MISLEEIKYTLQQRQFTNFSPEVSEMIRQIELIQNMEWEIREKFNNLKQDEPSQPEEGDMIFETEI